MVYRDGQPELEETDDDEAPGQGAELTDDPPLRAHRAVGTHYGGGLRGELIRAALEFIEEEGADRLSLRAVARRVGVSSAAPAHYFRDKEELFTAIAIQGLWILADRVINLWPFPGGDDVDRLGAIAKLYAQFATDHPARFEVMCRRVLVRSEDPRIHAAEDHLFLALGHLIGTSQQAGWRADDHTDSLAAAAWCLAHGYCALRAQGSLRRQFFVSAPPPVEELTATLAG
jgi:AcrR family transcriptional regulator